MADYVEDLAELTEVGEYLGGYLAGDWSRLVSRCNYGKVHHWSNGELEHGAAILHQSLVTTRRYRQVRLSFLLRKTGPAGTPLDVPLHYKDAAFVRTHYDAIEVRIPDAPMQDEIVVALAFTTGGRPHPRIGGLQLNEVKGEDGLR